MNNNVARASKRICKGGNRETSITIGDIEIEIVKEYIHLGKKIC